MALACDAECGQDAVCIIGDTSSGEQLAWCPEHLAVWCLTVADSYAQQYPEVLAQAPATLVAALAPPPADEVATARGRKRGRGGADHAAAAEEPVPEPAPAPDPGRDVDLPGGQAADADGSGGDIPADGVGGSADSLADR